MSATNRWWRDYSEECSTWSAEQRAGIRRRRPQGSEFHRAAIRVVTVALVVIGLVFVVALIASCKPRHNEHAQRSACLAAGGRIVPVHGGKYSAWICDLPRNVEVRP